MKSVTERNKQKVQLFVEAVLNEGRLELIEELVAADFVGRLTGVSSPVVGAAELRRLVLRGRRVYPDLYVKIEDQIAEEDRVVVRWRATVGTARGRVECWSGVSIVRLLAGKQVDVRTSVGSLETLGAGSPR